MRNKDEAMQLVDLAGQPADIQDQAAVLLHESFNHEMGWPTVEAARAEVAEILQQGFARALVASGRLLGWVGGV
jgi:hypothetical protein